MCGISGHLGTNFIKSNSLSKTLNLMKVRGPDNQSHMKFNLSNDINLNLLHSRLNIIDLNMNNSVYLHSQRAHMVKDLFCLKVLEIKG